VRHDVLDFALVVLASLGLVEEVEQLFDLVQRGDELPVVRVVRRRVLGERREQHLVPAKKESASASDRQSRRQLHRWRGDSHLVSWDALDGQDQVESHIGATGRSAESEHVGLHGMR
jgi:hypothetical protein